MHKYMWINLYLTVCEQGYLSVLGGIFDRDGRSQKLVLVVVNLLFIFTILVIYNTHFSFFSGVGVKTWPSVTVPPRRKQPVGFGIYSR